MESKNRTLASTLLSKLGGNVDHTFRTILQELIDNSLDAQAKNIYINIINNFLVVKDDGDGIYHLENIFTGDKAKKGKKGCKNNGFLDSLAFLSNFEGECEIITNNEGNFARIFVDFTEMKKEYERQKKDETITEIDYLKCQQKFDNDFQLFNNRSTLEFLERHPDVKGALSNGGTIIKIKLHNSLDVPKIDNEWFQYTYNQPFNLTYCGKLIEIKRGQHLGSFDKFKPATCDFMRYEHSDGTIYYRIDSDFGVTSYYKTDSANRICPMEKEKFDNYFKTFKSSQKIAQLKFNLISGEEAQKQAIIFGDNNDANSIDNLRNLNIIFKDRLLGPFKYPTSLKGIAARNLYNVRVLLDILDENLFKDIIMTNKAKTNIDNLDNSLVKFLDETKKYFGITYTRKLYPKDAPLKDRKGIPDMVEFLKDDIWNGIIDVKKATLCPEETKRRELIKEEEEKKRFEEEKKRLEEEEKREKLIMIERAKQAKLDKEKKEKIRIEREKQEKLKREKEERERIEREEKERLERIEREERERLERERIEKEKELQRLKANYQPWLSAIYCGFLNCNEQEGISAENEMIEVHFGYTGGDPKVRGNDFGKNWRRNLYIPINSTGCERSKGKIVGEWKIHDALVEKQDELGIVWRQNSYEYFKCPKSNVREVMRIIRKTAEIYESYW